MVVSYIERWTNFKGQVRIPSLVWKYIISIQKIQENAL